MSVLNLGAEMGVGKGQVVAGGGFPPPLVVAPPPPPPHPARNNSNRQMERWGRMAPSTVGVLEPSIGWELGVGQGLGSGMDQGNPERLKKLVGRIQVTAGSSMGVAFRRSAEGRSTLSTPR